jgi:hypothetical protein
VTSDYVRPGTTTVFAALKVAPSTVLKVGGGQYKHARRFLIDTPNTRCFPAYVYGRVGVPSS